MIAIHYREGSFSDKWIEYCDRHNIEYKLVNCYDSDIISQVEGCDGLMWHWPQTDFKATQFARQLLYSLELKGLAVFPDSNTCWHYDDKVGQKYLLEAIQADIPESNVFYDRTTALRWAEKTDFPKVFKLTGGAGSSNVHLVRTRKQAKQLINKAFSTGFSTVSRIGLLKERLWHAKRDKSLKSFFRIGKGLARLFIPTELEKQMSKEQGYIYFQEFIPENTFDIRVIIIGKRAFGIKRMVRDNDFRASGSGSIVFDPEQINPECIKLAFEYTRRINSQSVAYDFIFQNGKPLLVEISYAFLHEVYRKCPGYWDETMKWHYGEFFSEWFNVEDLVNSINDKKKINKVNYETSNPS
jgi:glutathione synthase/RimK-type ligase-like ATP-grasp enzyme